MRLLEQSVETSRGVFPVTELSVAGFRLLLAAEARGIGAGALQAFCPDALPVTERLTEGDLAKIMAAAARLNPDLFQGTADSGLADGNSFDAFSEKPPCAAPSAGLAQLEASIAALIRAGYVGLWDWPFSALLALGRVLEKEH